MSAVTYQILMKDDILCVLFCRLKRNFFLKRAVLLLLLLMLSWTIRELLECWLFGSDGIGYVYRVLCCMLIVP